MNRREIIEPFNEQAERERDLKVWDELDRWMLTGDHTLLWSPRYHFLQDMVKLYATFKQAAESPEGSVATRLEKITKRIEERAEINEDYEVAKKEFTEKFGQNGGLLWEAIDPLVFMPQATYEMQANVLFEVENRLSRRLMLIDRRDGIIPSEPEQSTDPRIPPYINPYAYLESRVLVSPSRQSKFPHIVYK